MKVFGIDFTSRPSRGKPITCACCNLDGSVLRFDGLELWHELASFEQALQTPGPWISGIDFPFGQSRTFIQNIGWLGDWLDYVGHAASLGRQEFRRALDNYRSPRPDGDKEHRRATDIAASSVSPQKLYGVPVGLMFFEGAPRLAKSGVSIPGILSGDPHRIVVEAYPGVLARRLVGRTSYKNDDPRKQTREQFETRRAILDRLKSGHAGVGCDFTIRAPETLINDPSGDQLDALLCAVRAAWAWTKRDGAYGTPASLDPLEGWIADPGLQGAFAAT